MIIPLFFHSRLLLLALTLCTSVVASAQSDTDIQRLQTEWAIANYQLNGEPQSQKLNTLLVEATLLLQQLENDPGLLIWTGIIESTKANVDGGLGALKLAKAAKAHFEKAIAIDATALNGSALTSLATLYQKVPGWPVGFGSDKKAEALFQRALEVAPNSIDSNYFYADYLIEKKQINKAKLHLKTALKAPLRPGRELADQGRRKEILAALARLDTAS